MTQNSIQYGTQDITQREIDAVVKVLKSDFLTQGPVLSSFEIKFSEALDVKFAVAVNSATSALHAACMALGVGPGDVVWTSPNSFVASANCALYCGASVDFVDIDIFTGNMCCLKLEAKLAEADKSNKLPKVLIPVHFSGYPCDMKRISQLCEGYGVKIIEDASHALGAEYGRSGLKVGSCVYSDITVFSFHPVKIITTAEGGAATTNDSLLNRYMSEFRSHGIHRDPTRFVRNLAQEPWLYEQTALGLNYRMTEMQACLGVIQLERLGEILSKRKEISREYIDSLFDLPISMYSYEIVDCSSNHLFPIRVDKAVRLDLFNHLKKNNIFAAVHYIPIHTQPYHKMEGADGNYCLNSLLWYQTEISLPLHSKLEPNDMDRIVTCIKNFYE